MGVSTIREARKCLENLRRNEERRVGVEGELSRYLEKVEQLEEEWKRYEKEMREWRKSPEGREVETRAGVKRTIEEQVPECAREELLGYYMSMKRQGLRAATMRGHISGLKLFVEWYIGPECGRQWSGWKNVSTQDLYGYMDYMLGCGLKTSTVRNAMFDLSAFFTYLVDDGQMEESPCREVMFVKADKPLPRAMTLEDLDAFTEALETAPAFDRAAMLTLLRTGMRVGELLGVRVCDVDMEDMSIRLYVGEKNRLGRVVYFTDDARDALREWMKERMRTGVDSEYLFAKKQGLLSYSGMRYVFGVNLERAGLKGKYSPHCLRHTFATLLANEGMDVMYLQRLMGHDSLQSTMRYVVVDEKEAHEEYYRLIEKIERRSRRRD
jgi:site-specific recombinase XerD